MDCVSNKAPWIAEALQLTGLPACACNADGTVFAVNREFDALRGTPGAAQALPDLFHADAVGALHAWLAAVHPAQGTAVFDSVLLGAAGAIAVQVHAKPLPASAGGAGAIFTLVDMRAAEQARAVLLEHQAMLENAAVGIFFTKPGVLINCNRRMAEMLGYTQAELAVRDAADIFPNQLDHDTLVAEADVQLRAGLPFEKAEYHARRRDGSMFWARIRARPIDPHARAAGTIWIVEDISDARRALVKVQAIMTNASVSILFTKDRVIRRCNSGFARMFGYPESAAVAMPARQLYDDEATYAGIGAMAYPALAQGQAFQGETTMVRSDGARLWVQLIGYLVVPGEVDQGTVWIIEDRTRHKRDEEALRLALLQNQAILDNAVLGIAVVENGRTLHANARMNELFAYPPDDAAVAPQRDRALAVCRRKHVAGRPRSDRARLRGGPRAQRRIRTGAQRRQPVLGPPVGPPVRPEPAARAQRVAGRRCHRAGGSGRRGPPRARRTRSAGAGAHGRTGRRQCAAAG